MAAFTCAAYRLTAVLVLAALILGCGHAPVQAVSDWRAPEYNATFWKIWGDGQAELSGYELTYPRYGQLRRGTAVTIFVTETFSNTARVKSDPGKHPAADEFPVMKLNLVKDFQTGIYDYNVMLSAFTALAPINGRPAGALTKSSFSSQEWCGHVFGQLLFDPTSIRVTSHSYFDGEADQQRAIEYPADAFSEDGILLWARRMAGPLLQPGQTRSLQLLTSLETARMNHVPLEWHEAVLSRAARPERLTLPGGEHQAEVYSVKVRNGPSVSVWVETPEPHRILQWESTTGERARLLGSTRLKYWTLNREGGESALKALGLQLRPPRTM